MIITQDYLKSLIDFEAATARVPKCLAAFDNEAYLLAFFRDYAEWNSYFAGGVCKLVANISGAVDLFIDDKMPRSLADRSNYIASYIFDAVRDEFDDTANRQRDPHRSMAQGFLHSFAKVTGRMDILDAPMADWLRTACREVLTSYAGNLSNQSPRPLSELLSSTMSGKISDLRSSESETIFTGIGYHLGSELLADQEFTIIDSYMRTNHDELVTQLKHSTSHIADADHRGYAWIGVHSGHGGGAEADHFDWALQGVNKALTFVKDDQKRCVEALADGFRYFNGSHADFFRNSTIRALR